jgi:hypothetical protein
MYDFNPADGAEKKWFQDGKLMMVIRAFKKKKKNGNRTKSRTVVRLISPAEYEAEEAKKLTGRSDHG